MLFDQRQKLWLWIIGLPAILYGLYLFNPADYYFVNDDLIHIPLSREGALFQRNSFRPVCDLSIQLDYLLWQKNAAGYHFVNLLLHIFNTILVFLLSTALFDKYGSKEGIKQKSIMVAVLFFVYAFHSESIFWILGRSASLGVLFFIPAVLFYLKRHQSISRFLSSIVFFIIGLLTYESVWIFPFVAIVIALIDRRRFAQNIKRELRFLATIFVVLAIYFLLRHQTIGELVGHYEASNFVQFDIARLATNFIGLVTRSFAPPAEDSRALIFILATLVGFAILVFIRSGRNKNILFLSLLLVLLVISYAPYLSLGINTHSVEGERFLYLPSIFVAILLVESISTVTSKVTVVLLLFSFLVAYQLYFLTASRNYYKAGSAVTKTTFEEINSLKGKQRLFIEGLPQSNRGALMFRLGLEEGIKWLKQDGTVDSVIVLSLKDNNSKFLTRFTSEYVRGESRTFNKVLVKGHEAVGGYVERSVTPIVFNKEIDALFIYTDRSLQVIK